MCRYYRMVYPDFDSAAFYSLMEKFGIPKDQKLATFSKGKKKQVSLFARDLHENTVSAL